MKVLITIKEDKKPKRPHQAFLRLEDTGTHLETSYAFAVKESGKGKVEIVSWLYWRNPARPVAYTTVGPQRPTDSALSINQSTFRLDRHRIIWIDQSIQ